jgi:hypothetical protein
VHDVDGVADVETFAEPARAHCPRVHVNPVGIVACSYELDDVGGHVRRRGDLAESQPAAWEATASVAMMKRPP